MKLKIIFLIVVFFGIFCLSSVAKAEQFYISQYGAGAQTGADCANAKTLIWFDTPANWEGQSNLLQPSKPGTTGKMGGGDTIHLCGTFNLPANGDRNKAGDLITFFGGGFNRNGTDYYLTLKWEDNAVVQSPLCDGGGYPCIYIHRYMIHSCQGCQTDNNIGWIILDGGTNGIVQNTDNGSPDIPECTGICTPGATAPPGHGWIRGYTHHQSSELVQISGDSNWGGTLTNIEVKNLTFQHTEDHCGANVYCHDSLMYTSTVIGISGVNKLHFHNNTVSDAHECLGVGAANDIEIDHNELKKCSWDIDSSVAQGGTSTDFRVHDNVMEDWSPYFCPSWTSRGLCRVWDGVNDTPLPLDDDVYHLDGATFWQYPGNAPWTVYFYNNYMPGPNGSSGAQYCNASWSALPGTCTPEACLTYGTNAVKVNYVGYNNVMVDGGFTSRADCCDGNPPGTGPHTYYNNTFIGTSQNHGGGINFNGVAGGIAKNNISTYAQFGLGTSYTVWPAASDDNLFYNDDLWNGNLMYGGLQYTFTNWKLANGGIYDNHSTNGIDPGLDSNYKIASTASVAYRGNRDAGSNLTSLCTGWLTALCYDKPATSVGPNAPITYGTQRPVTGAWDAGAYQYSGNTPPPPSDTTPPAVPTGLRVN